MQRKRMKKEEAADGDGLEIISIGSLYRAGCPSHKKYWSSSRGKDRYPYPVGYQAVRTYGEQTYKMEIREGSKGPLFVVTSADGDCYSGQTPDMAWGDLQRKSVKNWHGQRRRLSCVDGVELFGFRNSSVQRLLRGLIANVNGTSERNSGSSVLANIGLELEGDVQKSESCAYLDLVSCLEEEKLKGTEEKRTAYATDTFIHDESLSHPERHFCSSKQSNAFPSSSTDVHLHNYEVANVHLLVGPEQDVILNGELQEVRRNTDVMPGVVATGSSPHGFPKGVSHGYKLSDTPDGECCSLSGVSSPTKLKGSTFFEKVVPCEEMKTTTTGVLFPTVKLDLPPETNIKMSSGSLDAELVATDLATSKDGDQVALKRVEFVTDTDFHIPDTFDDTEDKCFAHTGRMDVLVDFESKGTYQFDARVTEKEFTAANELALPHGTVTSNPDERNILETAMLVDSDGMIVSQTGLSISCGSSNSSTEKADIDSAGQELARSMMTFLLPRAVPLLKRTYYRKRKRAKAKKREHRDCFVNKQDICFISDDLTNNKLHGLEQIIEEKMHASEIASMVGSGLDPGKAMHSPTNFLDKKITEVDHLKNINTVIPDSYDDDQSAYDVSAHLPVVFDSLVDKSPTDNIILSSTSPTCSGPELCKEVPTYDNHICLNVSTLPVTVGESTECSSPSFMVNGIFRDLDPCSIDTSSIATEEDAALLEFARVSKHLPSTLQKSYKIDKGTLVLEHHNDEFGSKSNTAELLERCLFLPTDANNTSEKNSKEERIADSSRHNGNALETDPKEDKPADNSVGNSGANASGICCDIFESNAARVLANHLMPHIDHDIETTDAEKFENFNSNSEFNPPSMKLQTSPRSIPYHEKNSGSLCCTNIDVDGMPLVAFTQAYPAIKNAVNESSILATMPKSMSRENLLPGASVSEFVPKEELIIDSIPLNNNANSIDPLVSKVDTFGECKPDRCFSDHVSASALNYSKALHAESVSTNKAVLSHTKIYEEKVVDPHSYLDYKSSKDFRFCLEPLGCYIHPNPVLSILVNVKGEEVVVCVLSGLEDCDKRDIFIYKISAEKIAVHPSFLGYTSVIITSPKDLFVENAKVSFEQSCMQFSPDAEFLLLHNSIKVPCCREQNCNFSCSSCDSDFCEESGVKLVHVEFGYVSIIKKLATKERVYCMLVCEPNYLIASVGSGLLHGWKMDSAWRDILEDFILPCFSNEGHTIVELKRLPCYSTIIIGHNGEGSFGLWDICTRVLLQRFSSPGNWIFKAVPIDLCCLVKDTSSNDLKARKLDIKHAQREELLFCHNVENYLESHMLGEDIALWILVLASCCPHEAYIQESGNFSTYWRLALLYKNKAILGNMLDPRACVAESSSGHGIVGTRDGLLYVWKTSTGEEIMRLNPFNGGAISCISADSRSGALTVAHENIIAVYFQKPPPVP